MKRLKIILKQANAFDEVVTVQARLLDEAVNEHDDALGMLTAFRHAANELALEAGVISVHVDHDEAKRSITGDHYFLQLIAEAELRLKRITAQHERLQKAARPFVRTSTGLARLLRRRGEVGAALTLEGTVQELQDALEFDLSKPYDYKEIDTHV